MRMKRTSALKPGMTLGKSIYNEKGFILLQSGITITEKQILRLLELNIPYVLVDDGSPVSIPEHALPAPLRRETIKTVKSVFTEIQKDPSGSAQFLEKTSGKVKKLIRSIMDEIKDRIDVLELLGDIYTYDHYLLNHSLNVTLYSLTIGIEMGLEEKQLESLGIGALLHDAGKMKISQEIILKPGRLTDQEYEIIKTHSRLGYDLLRSVHTIPVPAAHCAFQHHERLDGSGYPRGLAGEQIHTFGRIIAVADVFDAVTSARVYREAMLPHEGLGILEEGAGRLFDPQAVKAFRKASAIYPSGMTVQLSDGRKGIVADQNKGLGDRPRVYIVEESEHTVDGYIVDLARHPDIQVTACCLE